MNSLRKKLLILSCLASLAHCQAGCAGYFDAFSSYLTNNAVAKTVMDASFSLFNTACEYPRISMAVIGATSFLGSFSVCSLIQKYKSQRQIYYINEPEKRQDLAPLNLPEQVDPYGYTPLVLPEGHWYFLPNLDEIVLKMMELELLTTDKLDLIDKLVEKNGSKQIQDLSEVGLIISRLGVEDNLDQVRKFYTWLSQRATSNKASIKNF